MASRILQLGALAAFASQALASCAHGTLLQPRAEGAEGKVNVSTFGYLGAKGPFNWVSLDPEKNALCASGKHQSPQDMTTGDFTVIPGAELSIDIPDIIDGTEFENLGTTIEVVCGTGSISFQNIDYTLKQFHFHLPSEHLDNGRSLAMEMHMVWQSKDADIAVIGVFIDVAEDEVCDKGDDDSDDDEDDKVTQQAIVTATVTEIETKTSPCPERRSAAKAKFARRQITQAQRRDLPGIEGSFFHVKPLEDSGVSASKLLETVLGSSEDISEPGSVFHTEALVMSELVDVLTQGTFQTYEGSLTTPPCKEGVRWLVSDQKLTIKSSTYHKAQKVIGFNSRFPQNTLGEPNFLSLGSQP